MRESQYQTNQQFISVDDQLNIVKNQTQTISLHKLDKQYLILSKNNFKLYNNVGYFNRKTDFRIGEKNSIIILDKNLNIKYEVNTSELKPDDYILYPLPFTYLEQNETFIYEDYINNKTEKINLNFEFGQLIMRTLLLLASGSSLIDIHNFYKNQYLRMIDYDLFEKIMDLIIEKNKFGYSINKNIIINSNIEFILGLIDNIKQNIFTNINIYTFTHILNYIGAAYAITNTEKGRRLNFYISDQFKYFKSKSGIIFNENNHNINIKFKNDSEYIKQVFENTNIDFSSGSYNYLFNAIKDKKILPIKIEALDIIDVSDISDNKLYDYTMTKAHATNYVIPNGPLLKNSDGDILGLISIFDKNSLEEAKVFAPTNKDYYKDFNDGSIQNWITKDAVLGLYNATKHI